MNPIRRMADEIVDTSDMTVHELRHFFMSLSRDRGRAKLVLTVVSFGYKHGVPVDADLVFDVRFLPNPYYVEGLRALPGQSPEVRAWLLQWEQTREFERRLHDLLAYLLPQYTAEGKTHLTIAIGCTGGKHRSVVVGDDLTKFLRAADYPVRIKHRDVRKE